MNKESYPDRYDGYNTARLLDGLVNGMCSTEYARFPQYLSTLDAHRAMELFCKFISAYSQKQVGIDLRNNEAVEISKRISQKLNWTCSHIPANTTPEKLDLPFRPKTESVAGFFKRFLKNTSGEEQREFIDFLMWTHPTLQQSFMRLIMAFANTWKYSSRQAKEVIEAAGDYALPLI